MSIVALVLEGDEKSARPLPPIVNAVTELRRSVQQMHMPLKQNGRQIYKVAIIVGSTVSREH